MCSDRQAEANRKNAQRSTGPKTPEGKARSRANAWVHGLRAETIVAGIPGEESGRFEGLRDALDAEANPSGSVAGAMIAAVAAGAFLRLERCRVADQARVARRVREARRARHREAMAEVDALGVLLKGEPAAAARRLRETVFGCDFLLGEFALLAAALVGDPPSWDRKDSVRYCQLLGLATALRFEAPSPVGRAELRIDEHRRLEEKLRLNAFPDGVHWTLRYPSVDAHEADRRAFPEAERLGRAAADELRARIAAECDALRLLRATLLADDEADESEAESRSLFDPDEEGRLLHRYTIEAERSTLRALKALGDAARAEIKATRPALPLELAPDRPAPNEANRGKPIASTDLGFAYVGLSATGGTPRPHPRA